MLYEVIEPLTKKQYQTFDIYDEMRRNLQTMEKRYVEMQDEVNKVVRRNEGFAMLEK